MKNSFFWNNRIGAFTVGIGPFHLDPGGALGQPDGPIFCMAFNYNSISVKKFFVDKNVIFGTTCTSMFFSKYAFVIILRLIMLPDYHFDHIV